LVLVSLVHETSPHSIVRLLIVCLAGSALPFVASARGVRLAFSSARFGDEAHGRQVLEVSIAGQQIGFARQRGRINNGVGRRQFVPDAKFRRSKSGRGVEIGDDAGLGERNDPVGLSSPTSRVNHFASSN
jgi:hypothetical protein